MAMKNDDSESLSLSVLSLARLCRCSSIQSVHETSTTTARFGSKTTRVVLILKNGNYWFSIDVDGDFYETMIYL